MSMFDVITHVGSNIGGDNFDLWSLGHDNEGSDGNMAEWRQRKENALRVWGDRSREENERD